MTLRLIRFLFICATCCSGLLKAENSAPPAQKADYVLQPLDLIKVQVFQEEDLSRDVRISQENKVTLPLIGSIDLKGKTVRQAQDLVQSLYRADYLVNPQINIIVLDYAKRSINVLGSVGSPGVVFFPQEEGLSLLDAISRSGGFTRLADRKKVKLTRAAADGSSETFVINVDDILQGGTKDTWIMAKDDIVYVPERIF